MAEAFRCRHPPETRVLVVDDDVAVAEIAASALEDCGFCVKVATSARSALDVLRAGAGIELVFSDILMPGGMDGIELAEEVLHRYPNLPVLLTTGYSDSLRKATDLGLAIVPKPYRSAELCEPSPPCLGTAKPRAAMHRQTERPHGAPTAAASMTSRRAFHGSVTARGPWRVKSRIMSLAASYLGHRGRPAPLGSPVLAKLAQ